MKTLTQSMLRRTLCFVLAFAMVFSICMPAAVQAAENEVIDKSAYDNPVPTDVDLMYDQEDTASGYIANQYIEAYINRNGHYTMGTVEGDPNSDTDDNRKLLYGHPDSSTTETLIRIDGSDYFFDNYVTSVRFNDDASECVATAEIDGVTVQQILTLTTNPYTNIEDVIRIRYTCTNNSAYARQVGVRIMLDTMLGSNDGAPFRVNGQDVVREVEFSGNSVPQYWQSFDSLEQPNVTATGFFFFNEGEKPDKVQFAAWPSIVSSSWSYQVNENRSVTGDSAVAAYFDPRTIAAGGSRTIQTYYGISGFSGSNSDLDGELVVRITAPSDMYGSDMIGGYLNNPFDVSVYVTSPGSETLTDVRAVLSLAEAPQLVLDASQASTIRLGDMSTGETAAIQWTLRALPQGTTTTANYSISFYSGNELIKTMPLSLVLHELNQSDMYRTVTFDLNGAEGTAPASQQVMIGSFADRPANPERRGYIFAGWYPNQACTGFAWFGYYNLYQGNPVVENVTLYAKWVDKQSLTYGEDTFSFINTYSDFFTQRDLQRGDYDYQLSGDYYDILLSGRTNSEKQTLRRQMSRTWGGSCFGMSCVLSLVRAGELDVGFFQGDATRLFDLDAPRDSETVFNLVNYYHLLQLVGRTATARGNYNHSVETSNNRAIIEALNTSSYPVVVGFDLRNVQGSRTGGHAVVAYGYTETADNYQVMIWDPNDQDSPNTLIISKDFTTSYFAHTYDTSSGSTYMKYALTVEAGDYDYRNIQEELINLGRSSGAEANGLRTQDDGSRLLNLQTNYASFTITGSDGTSAVIENGVKVSGDLNISDAEYFNEMNMELAVWFAISDSGNVNYSIVPVAAVSALTGEPLAEYRTVLSCNDEVDGFYADLTAENTGVVTFGADGTVSTEYEEDTYQLVVVAVNDADTAWSSVTAEATGSDLNVTPDSENTAISSQSGADVTVIAEDDYSDMTFDTMTLEAGEQIQLIENADSPRTGILDGQEQMLGYALVFYTQGGTPIAAQSNIPEGSTAFIPEAPTRDGFVFSGWYMTEECADGEEWSFNTPITENTKVYAKWLVNENYIHTVTFKANGHDDIIVTVRDGASLTEDQIPEVPQTAGYIGEWDIQDFSNITSDLIVRATYTVCEHPSYESAVTPPTCMEQGYTTYTCTVCGESYMDDYTDTVDHSYEHGHCIWCDEPQPVRWYSGTTSLKGTIDLNMYVILAEELVNDPETFVRFTFEYRVVDVPMADATPYTTHTGETAYRFSCPLFAKQVADQIVVQVMQGDTPVGDPKSYSAMQYCQNLIRKNEDPEQVAMCKAMLNYATAAQLLFNYNTDNLANASLSEEDKNLPDVDASDYQYRVTGSEPGIRARSATMMMESEIRIRVYFELEDGHSIDEYTFVVDGVEVQPQQNADGWFIESTGIPAKQMEDMHWFCCGGIMVRYSALSYVNSKLDSDDPLEVNLAKALYAYYIAAEELLS